MKVRFDFVSNSSSSSFVVSNEHGNVSLLAQKYAETFRNCETSYEYDSDLTVHAYTKNRDFREVQKFFNEDDKEKFVSPFSSLTFQDSIDTNAKLSPDDDAWEPISIELDDLRKLAEDAGLAKKVVRLYFGTTDDYNDRQDMRLATFYKFCDAVGCDPDASVSERDFLHKDTDQFESRMIEEISKAEKRRMTGEMK